MWQVIKLWKNLWIIKNKNKFGKPYWFNTYIIPIRDENSNINRIYAQLYDLTDVYHLNHEIELTQPRIVYKMGEIAGNKEVKKQGITCQRVRIFKTSCTWVWALVEKEATILFTASPMMMWEKLVFQIIYWKNQLNWFDEFENNKTITTIGFNILKRFSKGSFTSSSYCCPRTPWKMGWKWVSKDWRGEDIHIFGRITAVADVLIH